MDTNKWMIKLFEKSRKVGPLPSLLKVFRDKFIKTNMAEFESSFKDCLLSVIVAKTNVHRMSVNNMIKFAANGVSLLCDHSSKDRRSGLLLMTETIRLCRIYGSAKNKNIRWRFCLLLNNLLNFVDDGTVLAVEFCDVVTLLLLERLKDKKPDVRAQAALALNRLQTPDDPKCRIVQKFLFHMTSDPSVEVRTAIVKGIALFNNVIDVILKNTVLDVSDTVRKEAYKRFLTFPFSSLSPLQLQKLCQKGLDEKNESIRSFVINRLLKHWLNEYDNDFVKFLNKLDVQNEHICEKTIITLFKTFFDSQILDKMNSYLNPVSRTIDFEKLSLEKIFLWKCVAKYLTTEKKIKLAHQQGHVDEDFIDLLLPDLVMFSDYVRDYYFSYDCHYDKEFILTQLLDMTITFTIDDAGAKSLNTLCFDILLDSKSSVRPIKNMAIIMNSTLETGEDFLNYVKYILNGIQEQTIDAYPIIEKVGMKELLKEQITKKSNYINEHIENEIDNDNIETLIIQLKEMKDKLNKIDLLPRESMLVDNAVNYLLKAFELIFQVQQFPKVGSELSLLTDIIQNFVHGYLESSMVNLRMGAIRALAPFMLADNAVLAKDHMNILCNEVSQHNTDKLLLYKIMFELFLRYDFDIFGVSDDLDTDEDYDEVFDVGSVLPLLARCIGYEVFDGTFESELIKGFCNLLIFDKIKSINLFTKLLILWFARRSEATVDVYNTLVTFFTTYMFYINTSSSTIAKCFVPMLRVVKEHDLTSKVDVKLDEINSTLVNFSQGIVFENENVAINAHGELASYILDYLEEENQSYTGMLIDILSKLVIDFDCDEESVQILRPKLMRLIKRLKKKNNRESNKYLKKILLKYDPVLQKKETFKKKNCDNNVEVEKEPVVVPSRRNEKPDHIVEVPPSDLFSQELMGVIAPSDSDDSDDELSKLDAVRRMSEGFKKTVDLISDSD